ncbi:stringent starvation protein B [Limnohabitans sp. MORI2]|uniref:ClpXP protease specificity-enhancing factor n=1 Tax=Limnohabitans sp. MORI2 TaxID=1751150 RepID=UPI002376E5A2|nr:ClpXP protease specificity-enhancing factor [Limnohabitans sp. MORI2]BDU59162.1 stringent starvation protein B [Limnohabitans sp. MORI2]
MLNAPDASSTRPYLLRALHEWCTDSGFTPYVAVLVDETVQVPMEYVKNGEIVLNVGYDATAGMTLGNEYIEFKARFGGVPRDIIIPVNRVMAIYARENGQGMAFPMSVASDATPVPKKSSPARPVLSAVETPHSEDVPDDEPPTPTSPAGRPTLTRVK